MHRKLFLAALALVVALTPAACGGGNERVGAAIPTGGDAAATVRIADMSFSPSTVEINAGDTVAWVWDDRGVVHDVAFDDGPASPKQRDGTWPRTFDRPGTYEYVCTLHPNMAGQVIVR